MSIKIMTLVWDTDIGPATKRLVLLALADSANDEGSCFLLISTLARKACAGESTVQRVLAELENEDNLIRREFRANRSTIFHLNVDAIRSRIETGSQIETPSPQDRDPRGSQIETHNRPSPVKEPTTAPDGAEQPEERPSSGPTLHGVAPADVAELTINQRATRLAQNHYERLGKMGNVPAMMKIVKKALEHDYTDATVDRACAWIADHQWTLTEERLANTLRGGPKPPNGRPPVNGRPIARTGSGMEIQTS
jgi:hypothetical protein